jgi:hypothetical protein
MLYILTLVEQLDRAARELATDHPINNRIALILVDNAVELIIHHRLRSELQFEHVEQRLTPKQRLMARGAFLEGKLNVLERLNKISAQERQFIKICHDYRNELYHVGLKHENIIRAIAAEYFKLACELFVRLPRGGRSWGSNDSLTDVARSYIGTDDHWAFHEVSEKKLADNLRAALPAALPGLQSTLHQNAEQSIDGIKESLDFLVTNNPNRDGVDEILRLAQFQYEQTRALARAGIEGTWLTPGYSEAAQKITAELKATWKQRHPSVPIRAWHKRAGIILQEKDSLVSLALFQALRTDMTYLENALSDLADDLEGWVQLQIDVARDK